MRHTESSVRTTPDSSGSTEDSNVVGELDYIPLSINHLFLYWNPYIVSLGVPNNRLILVSLHLNGTQSKSPCHFIVLIRHLFRLVNSVRSDFYIYYRFTYVVGPSTLFFIGCDASGF